MGLTRLRPRAPKGSRLWGRWGVGRSKERDGATVTGTGSGQPALRQALQARGPDLDLIRELPSGPAACEPSRIKGRTHVSTRPRAAPIQKILLAPKRASTHVAKFENGRGMGWPGPHFTTVIRGQPSRETN